MEFLNNFDYMAWVVIPALVFLARLIDVTLATLRHILIYKDFRKLVPALAFVEVSIWLLAITQVMQNLTNWACFFGWAAGFSAGTYVGIVIEERLALGYQLVRVITNRDSSDLLSSISKKSFGVTSVKALGSKGSVEVLLIVSERRRLKGLLDFLKPLDPSPFYTVEDVRTVGRNSWAKNGRPGGFAMEGDLKKK